MAACQHCGDVHSDAAAVCPLTGESMAEPGPCGSLVDRYFVERLVGRGGFGAVYRARHDVLGQAVALKLLHVARVEDTGSVQRFVREARAMAAITHPNVARVVDCGNVPPARPFLVLEWLEGESLAATLLRERTIFYERACDITLQILDGLASVHAAGIVHRDMKPANVILVRSAEARADTLDFAKVVDFGVSKIASDAGVTLLTKTGMTVGTPRYIAPEQFRDARSVDARADLFAVAVLLYEMLSGELPFSGRTVEELMVRMATERPTPLRSVAPAVPSPLAAVVERGLARDPDARWQNAAEMADAILGALDAALGGDAQSSATASARARSTLLRRTHRGPAATSTDATTTPRAPRSLDPYGATEIAAPPAFASSPPGILPTTRIGSVVQRPAVATAPGLPPPSGSRPAQPTPSAGGLAQPPPSGSATGFAPQPSALAVAQAQPVAAYGPGNAASLPPSVASQAWPDPYGAGLPSTVPIQRASPPQSTATPWLVVAAIAAFAAVVILTLAAVRILSDRQARAAPDPVGPAQLVPLTTRPVVSPPAPIVLPIVPTAARADAGVARDAGLAHDAGGAQR